MSRRISEPSGGWRDCSVCGARIPFEYPSGRRMSSGEYARRIACSTACIGVIARQVRDAKPYRVAGRTLVARTCDTCGEMRDASSFERGTGGWRHTCRKCRGNLDVDQLDRNRISNRHTTARSQNRTLDQAQRRGYQWTGPELEVVLRQDLTAEVAARMLGRTLYAVRGARAKARHDPKWVQLVGLGDTPRQDA